MTVHRVYLGIGSNLGQRKANCRRAIEQLRAHGVEILKESSLYETQPWGLKGQPDFINMAVEASTTLTPEELLVVIKEIETSMGREETVRWGPRLIDIDILLYDDRVINTTVETASQGTLQLCIPHPFMERRDFVLRPLVEVSPDVVHPPSGKTARELLKDLLSQEGDL